MATTLTRTAHSLRNISAALIGYMCTILLTFLVRTVFIKQLGSTYLGINGLFSNILFILSFAELGLGTAIIYSLYKPLAENDKKQISAILNFYALSYRIIGCSIILFGIILLPFLNYIVGDKSQLPSDIPPLKLVFLLYVLNVAGSYFFNYKRSLLIASQNGRIDSLNQLIYHSARDILQIIFLIVFKSFLLFLIIQILFTLIGNIAISRKANIFFPFLDSYKHEKIDSNTLAKIKKNVLAMICHKIGSVIVSGTDNIFITHFVGLLTTGIYSNYILIKSTILSLIQHVMTPLTASVGNMIATESKDRCFDLFNRIFFANAYIAIVCSALFQILVNRFIFLMWGGDNMLSNLIVALISTNFYLTIMRKTSQIFIDSSGLFWQIKWKSIVEGVINIIASISFAMYFDMGLFGIVLGTITSNLCTNFWWEPYVVFRYFFYKPILFYFVIYVRYLFIALFVTLSGFYFGHYFPFTFKGLFALTILAFLYINLIFFLFFSRSAHLYYYLKLFQNSFSYILKTK